MRHPLYSQYTSAHPCWLCIICFDLINAAPGVPQNIQAILECRSTVLNVTWQQTGEATQYRAMVKTSGGQVFFPVTDKLFFTVSNISCGLTYDVTVVAQNDRCNSSQSSVQSAISGVYIAMSTQPGISQCYLLILLIHRH
ncbi:MAG: fibronectin type III domain-containing protein [Gammaproteobacteria bacterium]